MSRVARDKIMESELIEIVSEKFERDMLKRFFDFDEDRIEEIISGRRKNREFISSVIKDKLINLC